MRIIVLAVIFLSAVSEATQSCNLVNFGVVGGQSCGLAWWQGRDLGQSVEVTYKLSQLAENVMEKFGLPLQNVNSELTGNIMAESSNPLAKIIESALAVEPSITAMLADLIAGLDITGDEMERVGLPRALAQNSALTQLIKDYIDLSCSEFGAGSAVECIKTWVNSNCGAEDNSDFLIKLLDGFKNAYCDNKGSGDSDVIDTFTNNLGSLTKSAAKLLGIKRDPNSPFLFNLTSDSIITNQSALIGLSSNLLTDCQFYIKALTPAVTELVKPNSTVGAGTVLKTLLPVVKSYDQCAFESISKLYPDFFTKDILETYNLAYGRYGLGELKIKEIVTKEERKTVSVFGDPHMLTYKEKDVVTCAAMGWKTYLLNDYFHLEAYAEPATAGSQATYATELRINFMKNDKGVNYMSGKGSTPPAKRLMDVSGSDVTKAKSVSIIEIGDGVEITQLESGAVFGIKKYKHTYYFTVRMGTDVFDRSYGLLIDGCFDPLVVDLGNRRKRSTECETACAAADRVLRESCVYDCDVTGDTEVIAISTGLRSLENDVEKKDKQVLENLASKPTNPDKDGKDKNSVAQVTSQLIMVMFACVVRFI